MLLKKLKKVEKIGYHSNSNFECNTQRGSIEQLYIALGITPVLHTVDLIECHIDWKPGELRTVMKIKVSCISPIYRAWCCEIVTLLWTGPSKVNILQKPRSKVAQNSSNPLFSLLPWLPNRPKQNNSCSKMWPID